MVLINKAINEVTVKLVYYGPGLCGKTTNLEKIYANPKLDNKGKLISMSTETDRTLFFDFMPMELGTIAGQKVRVQLYTVPGQVFYDATRKLVLRGADGVVFVADSQSTMRESNLDSLNNLRANLRANRIDPDKVALVFQYNKRDLSNADTVEAMTAYLNPGNAPFVEASAITGNGVTATLRAAVSRILDNLKNHVDATLYEAAPLAAPDMTQKSGVAQHSAGTPKLTMSGGHPAPAPAPAPVAPPAPVAEAEPAPAPDAAPFFDTGELHVEPDENPFANVDVAVAEPEFDEAGDEDLFADSPQVVEAEAEPVEAAAAAPDPDNDPALANARALVASLEAALERAKENERLIAAGLGIR